MAMPHIARHLIPVAVTSGAVKLAVDSISSTARHDLFHALSSSDHGAGKQPGDVLSLAACIVLTSMMSSRWGFSPHLM